jgi:hypothetical protein
MTFEDTRIWIALVALAFAIVSFGLYVRFALHNVKVAGEASQRNETTIAAARTKGAVSPTDMAELIKAMASLTEALVKAGPALWSLIGTVLLLLIASVSAGALQTPETPPAAEEPGYEDPGAEPGAGKPDPNKPEPVKPDPAKPKG